MRAPDRIIPIAGVPVLACGGSLLEHARRIRAGSHIIPPDGSGIFAYVFKHYHRDTWEKPFATVCLTFYNSEVARHRLETQTQMKLTSDYRMRVYFMETMVFDRVGLDSDETARIRPRVWTYLQIRRGPALPCKNPANRWASFQKRDRDKWTPIGDFPSWEGFADYTGASGSPTKCKIIRAAWERIFSWDDPHHKVHRFSLPLDIKPRSLP